MLVAAVAVSVVLLPLVLAVLLLRSLLCLLPIATTHQVVTVVATWLLAHALATTLMSFDQGGVVTAVTTVIGVVGLGFGHGGVVREVVAPMGLGLGLGMGLAVIMVAMMIRMMVSFEDLASHLRQLVAKGGAVVLAF